MLQPRWHNLETVLCLGAHADDIEIGCGGTMLRLVAECPGVHVRWVVFSAEGTRRAEAQDSARRFLEGAGGADVEVLQFPDRYLPAAWAELKRYFDDLGQRCAPDLVLTHRRDDAHQDHRVLGELTWNTFRRHSILEYEIPKYEGDLAPPNLFVALSEALLERKAAMLMESFPSQRGKASFSADMIRAIARIRGLEANADTTYAEGFVCRKLTL